MPKFSVYFPTWFACVVTASLFLVFSSKFPFYSLYLTNYSFQISLCIFSYLFLFLYVLYLRIYLFFPLSFLSTFLYLTNCPFQISLSLFSYLFLFSCMFCKYLLIFPFSFFLTFLSSSLYLLNTNIYSSSPVCLLQPSWSTYISSIILFFIFLSFCLLVPSLYLYQVSWINRYFFPLYLS